MSRADGTDPLHRGTLGFKQHSVAVTFDVLEGVFSAATVDAGTRHLLRWLAADRYRGARRVLDVGCGYGPFALWLAAAAPDRRVLAVDRDARALLATARGAARNGVDDRVEVRGSLGYDDVADGERFDLVVSNIPAKVGSAALRHLLLDARHVLAPDGLVAVVVVERLAAEVDEGLGAPGVELLDRRPTRGYVAYEYRFSPLEDGLGAPGGEGPGGFSAGAYRRGRRRFRHGDLRWEAEVSHSIAEFDALGHGTEAALELLVGRRGRRAPDGDVAVWGAGQGHVPLALAAAGHEGAVALSDRDLLALRTADANLTGAGRPSPRLLHEAAPSRDAFAGAGTVVVALPEREPVGVTAAVLGPALAAVPGADVLLHGRAADVSRVLELLGRHGARVEVVDRAKVGHHAAARGRATPPA